MFYKLCWLHMVLQADQFHYYETEQPHILLHNIFINFSIKSSRVISQRYPLVNNLSFLPPNNVVDKWKINWGKRDWRYWKKERKNETKYNHHINSLYLTMTVTIKTDYFVKNHSVPMMMISENMSFFSATLIFYVIVPTYDLEW